jgi:dephospho-CoA kinase
MIRLGLTGSIGMGKSTTAQMFRNEGIPVHDADQVVHDLYAGPAAISIEAAFPGTTCSGVVDRKILASRVVNDPAALARLENLIHPLVRNAETSFLKQHENSGTRLVVLDIPLLFETGAQNRVDKVLVVTASPEIQRQRVLERPGMSEDKFAAIVSRQLPDAQKRARADFVIDTGLGMDNAHNEVREIIHQLTAA